MFLLELDVDLRLELGFSGEVGTTTSIPSELEERLALLPLSDLPLLMSARPGGSVVRRSLRGRAPVAYTSKTLELRTRSSFAVFCQLLADCLLDVGLDRSCE
jgi:hypothetical protein